MIRCAFAFWMRISDVYSCNHSLNDSKKFTLAIGLLQFQGEYSTKWNLVMAASTVVILPCLIAFLPEQKQLIEGITLTGLKG